MLHLIKTVGFLSVAAVSSLSLPSTLVAEDHLGRWVSHPRALIMIVVGENGGRISGPEWEYTFAADAAGLDFEIAPGRRFVLRRSGETWVGEYFHPPIRPGDQPHETHSMLLVRDKIAAR